VVRNLSSFFCFALSCGLQLIVYEITISTPFGFSVGRCLSCGQPSGVWECEWSETVSPFFRVAEKVVGYSCLFMKSRFPFFHFFRRSKAQAFGLTRECE